MSKKNGKLAASLALKNDRIAYFVPPYAREMILESLEEWESELEQKGDCYRNGDENDEKRLKLVLNEIALLDRLGSDGRMRKLYADLTPMFADDKEQIRWIRFVVACMEALDDFSYERWLLEEGQYLQQQIHDAASKLWVLLLELEELAGHGEGKGYAEHRHEGLNWPVEFFWMTTESRFVVGKDRKERWAKWVRRKLAKPVGLTDYSASVEENERRKFLATLSTQKQRYSYIRPADVVNLIRREAQDWKPLIGEQSGPAEVVLASQKRSPKMRVIRTFWYCLTWRRYSYGVVWKKNAKMMRAVADVCDVILNDPKDSVEYADVKYALNIFDKRDDKNPPKKRRIRTVD